MATFTRADLTLRPVAAVRILGIDPGTLVVGFGCLEVELAAASSSGAALPLALRTANAVRLRTDGGEGPRVVAAGVLRLGGKNQDITVRLCSLAEQFVALLARFAPDEIALEEAFYGKSVPSALRIGEARGVILAEAGRRDLAVHQFAPARVKRCVTGQGAASKETVAAMLGSLLPGAAAATRDWPPDAADALAVALARVEERRSPMLAIARDGGDVPRTRNRR
jgi:crossover junction endodeoxyribonuclease RuvC